MADPRTKEELLAEINNKKSDNKTYTEFKESLQNLVQDIDDLMNPSEEGWKLLDKETTESLYEKYMNTAKQLNAYLKETEKSEDPAEKEIWEVCSAFRNYFAADMEVIRKYRNAKGELKSMPTLFEEARTHTVNLYNNDVDIKGGALSARMPMKILKKDSEEADGEEMDGFFTKAEYFDPVKSIQAIMDKQAERTGDPIGQALLLNFTKICQEAFRKQGFGEDRDAHNFKTILARMGKVVKDEPVMSSEGFAKGFASIIRQLGADRVAEICGLDEYEVPQHSADILNVMGNIMHTCAKLAMQWNAISCMEAAGIDYKARIDTRNVAMSDVAELLGVGNVICKARRMKVRDKDGNESDGIFMARAKGVDPNHPGPGFQDVSGRDMTNGDCKVLKQLADLQVLDYICGNIDRHGANFFYVFDRNNQIIGVQGIDNDLSFGNLNNINRSNNKMMAPADMGVISKSMADKILALDTAQFTYTLYGTLNKDEVEAARTRLEYMKEAITKSREIVAAKKLENPEMDVLGIKVPFGYLREIDDDKWRAVRMRDLYRKNGPKNIFMYACDTLDEFPLYSTLPPENVKYADTGAANRALGGGIISAMKKTKEMKDLLDGRTKTGRSSDNYRDVQDAVNKHLELLMKIGERMGACRSRVKAGTAETEDFFNRYVTKSDMDKIIASEQKIREMANKYTTQKMADMEAKFRIPANLDPEEKKRMVKENVKEYTRNRIEAIDLITETFRNGQTITPEEDAALKANHRRAVEDIVREIRKNPDSPAAGPKNPAHMAAAKNPPTL